MLRTLDLRGLTLSSDELNARIPRVASADADVSEVVGELLEDVRLRGEEALRDQAQRFDGGAPEAFRLPDRSLGDPGELIAPELSAAIDESISRVRRASAAQVPAETTVEVARGAKITQRWVPVQRAGVYVPGGKAVYPSSVVMNVVAAQAAGVLEIALTSPAQADFGYRIHPSIEATAVKLGVDEVYQIGGAAAIGAFAYGVSSLGLEPVSVISGPGNRYVAMAKRLVSAEVGIDSEAGPTEIAIIADHTASPEFIAADLVSQAEHDELAQVVLITTDAALVESVRTHLERRARATAHADRVRQALGGQQSAIIIVDSVDQALAVSDALAPEHLEIMTDQASDVAQRVNNAGAIFVGPYTPVSAGDYLAGSNHVLPTGGNAKFQAGLSAMSFLRPQQIVHYDRSALQEISDQIQVFARAENLPAHAEAIEARWQDGVGE